MNGVRTRKKTVEAMDGSDRKLNGHTSPRDRDGALTGPSENVFLFYPNIIGTPVIALYL